MSHDPLRFAAALSTRTETAAAIAEVCEQAVQQLGATPDLAVVFVSHDHGPDFAPLVAEIRRRTGARHLIGCTGESIVGGAREIEGEPALSLWLAALPGVTLAPMRLTFERTPDGGTLAGWRDDLPARWPAGAALLALGEPFSFPVELLLDRVSDEQPGAPVVGGMASGAHSPGGNAVFLDDQVFDAGAVAVLVHGPVRVRSIVSQGCRPIGRTFVVTRAEQNVIHELGGMPALAQLQEVFAELTDAEQQTARSGVHLGRVINEYQDTFARGDFLVRNVMGADAQSGAIAVGDYVRVGQTVQFHIRDAESADDDLRQLLTEAKTSGGAALAGLLFTCNGRGTRLFDAPHHDAGACREVLGELPLAGFFAQGELGPVGGRNFIHGFTASVALFERPPAVAGDKP